MQAKRAQHTKDYEAQITHAPGLDYVVRTPGQNAVKFDGCAVWDPNRQLLEAKGLGYVALHKNATEYGFYGSIRDKDINQAQRQANAADGRPVEWHVAEEGALGHYDYAVTLGIRELYNRSELPCGADFRIMNTSPR
jgi:hypothetical protein